jgi:HPt (histidine-containing phosphotransfer) domain-containing protein
MTAIEDRLAAARRRYLASLREKADDLEFILGRGDLTELKISVHRLAGSAALHELDPIAARARAAEALCTEPISPELSAVVRELARLLRDAHVPT